MALFQNLTKTLRPSSSNAISTLRWARSPCSSKLGPNFFGGGGPNGRRSYYGSHNSSEPMNKRLIYGVIGLNVGVYLYGEYTKEQARQGYPQSFITYIENMSLSPSGFFKEHRYWTAITSTFAHGSLFHIASNMVSFYYLSSFLASTPSFTPLKLTAIILGSGLAGSAGWLASKLKQGNVKQRALGFSGSVMGVGTIAAFLYPRVTLLVWGIIPVPLGVLMAGYAIYDGYYLNSQTTTVAHAGHLGGTVFGILYFLAKLRGLRL
ncbi:hypothetical protein GRF29_103g976501 [Pseudopithomyces chartarum]|uniref:Peptidase S54 rhomboid domain-containing protein n=1 Tax=Pseudopithomyces chartarum TaxID=1892770 RepID=A0AAN6RHJ9_9PLEO|nr:hypothetical protein GRF29_103g976501 [Pseudopithomyces chartarum]